MPRLTGKNLYVEFDGIDLSGNQRTFSVNEEQQTVDATAGSDKYQVFIPTVATIGADIEIIVSNEAAGNNIKNKLKPGTIGNLVWGAEGNTTGKPKSGFEAMISSVPKTINYNDVYVVRASFVNQGEDLLFDERDGDTW